MAVSGKKIILGVTGGIAAYKAAEMASRLVRAGAELHVVMTAAAKQFVGPATFQGLTRRPVYENVIIEEKEGQIAHIDLADTADLVLIAPATAHTIARLAQGLADDMLTAVVLATRAPVWVAPAMNVNMYHHPAVQKNIDTLAGYGYRLIGPGRGRLACGWTGLGRLVEPDELFQAVETYFSEKESGGARLKGKKIIVTAGPTREALDPVRFFSNYSSGKMGYAIAEAAYRAGAEVTLITGPTALHPPFGVSVIRVESAREMFDALTRRFSDADAVVKAAAVADYRPAEISLGKIKKTEGPYVFKMVRNPDILKTLGQRKTDQLLVGFAAETDHLEENARKKLKDKHLDMLVANKAEDSFGKNTNTVTFYFADGKKQRFREMPKQHVAEKICEALARLMKVGERFDR
ncbi:bifunctional phosphopantothenoylcysteine decarboxylase/phosphopantothenate--cysteine ligase CoaBC [Sporolactobacillus sp. THM7-7]|nr:bifunctional phosphopantothenoylcysteine decarboxylase/phosphopantothenate--cysteine ligase CoaBC [Sporolactobacillus sp. THM7-7]